MPANPYLLDGPALISFSGGRTSAYMLWHCIQAHGGRLPSNVHVAFQDTGDEHDGTYAFVDRCAAEWGVQIERLRYGGSSDNRHPFDAMIEDRGRLPNSGRRLCTMWMKVHVGMTFMQAHGYQTWTHALGLRADEAHRVRKQAGPATFERSGKILGEWENVCPLAAAGVTKRDIQAWWSDQPFDLDIPPGFGNCIACFQKGKALLVAIEQAAPGSLEPMAARERGRKHQFIAGVTYDQLIAIARTQGTLPLHEPAALDCHCHD